MAARSAGTGDLPLPLDKRDLLYDQDTSKEDLVQWGRTFQEAGRAMDALMFFVQARSEEDLRRLRRQAVEEGDLFALHHCCRGLGEEPDDEELEELAANAEAAGKTAFAARARGQEVGVPSEVEEPSTADE